VRDNATNEPIQHIYGQRERDGRSSTGMKSWPTFRMSFRGFQKAYPDGEAFLNRPSSNPFLRLLDMVTDPAFSIGIDRQHREEKPVMDNMSHTDDRLPNKTCVWGINIGDDAVCYTQDFIVENGNLMNAMIGGRLDFFGASDQGILNRVETLKPGLFWHVWVEFYRQTDINRLMDSG
jgi:hypothetical protein